MPPVYRAGMPVADRCRVCKEVRGHTVIVVDGAGWPLRVICDTCSSQHNFRGGAAATSAPAPRGGAATYRVTAHDSTALVEPNELIASGFDLDGLEVDAMELEMLLRRIIREETGLKPLAPAARWRGGELVLVPGKEGLKEHRVPIETFFRKITSVRNKLRVLEQQVNSADELSDELKIKLQGYITGAYGSLTSFNILFADEEDKFKGSGS